MKVFGIAGFSTATAMAVVAVNQWATHTQIKATTGEIHKGLSKIQKDICKMNNLFDSLEKLIKERNRRW
jgi:hypothetical protein